MAWQDTLISLFLYICEHYKRHLCVVAQRLTNNDNPDFTDEEVLTIYLYGIIKKKKTLLQLYDDTHDHLHKWFPRLPSYVGFVQRLNRLSDVFPLLAEAAIADCARQDVVESDR